MTYEEARKYLEISRRVLDAEEETYAPVILEKQALDLAIKALHIVDVIDKGFESGLELMDEQDWNDIKRVY